MAFFRGISLIGILAALMLTACGQSRTIEERDDTVGTAVESSESSDSTGDTSSQGNDGSTDTASDASSDTGSSQPDDTTNDPVDDTIDDTTDDTSSQDEGETTQQPASDPIEAGDYAVISGEESYTTPDGTNVTVYTYVPEASGTYPAVIFGHGFMLSPDLYASYGAHLASWGFVVLMPDYPGNMFSPTDHRTLKEYGIGLIDWLEGEPGSLAGKVEIGKIAMTGHSLGGKVAMMVATEDSRVKAVFGIDAVDATGGGPMGGGPTPENPSVTPELMGLIDIPMVSLGETLSGEGGGLFSQACAPSDQNYQQYFSYAEGPALEITILNASHMSFLDDPNCGITCSVCTAGTDDTDMTRALTQRYLTAFFQATLNGNRGYLPYLMGAAMDADVAGGLVEYASKNGFGN